MKKKNSRILIICPSMWPKMNSWGETQRMYYLSNYLSQHGWEVHTIAPAFEGNNENCKREITYKSCFLGDEKAQEISKAIPRERKRESCDRLVRKVAATILIPVIGWFYNEPDCLGGIYKQIWVWKYRKEIENYIIKNNIEKVIISVPSFTLMQFGRVIHKQTPDVEIIYDYRDPWHLWNGKRNFAYYREKRYLRWADKVIGFSEAFSEDMIQKMGVKQENIFTVYNGYSEADWENFEKAPPCIEEKRRDKLCLTFTGNITLLDRKDNFRNPWNLIKVVKKYTDVELYFVGIRDARVGTVEGNVHFVGNVSQSVSFEYMMKSDVLVNIHDTNDNSGKYIVSGKFYDYMRSGKVIWHIGSSESLMTKMIQEYQLGVWCENAEKELENMLMKLIQNKKKGTLTELRNCDTKETSIFSREYQNKKYEGILCAKINTVNTKGRKK